MGNFSVSRSRSFNVKWLRSNKDLQGPNDNAEKYIFLCQNYIQLLQ